MTEAADEIARLRGEVERLTRQVDHWIGYARTTETHAARLEDRRADLAARAADLALKAQAVAKADRAALATRVAEAVREACKQAVIGTYGDARNHHRMDAIDLGPVVAAALKESAP
jgi:D-arabinose 5-phosphate isomerase GutQ